MKAISLDISMMLNTINPMMLNTINPMMLNAINPMMLNTINPMMLNALNEKLKTSLVFYSKAIKEIAKVNCLYKINYDHYPMILGAQIDDSGDIVNSMKLEKFWR